MTTHTIQPVTGVTDEFASQIEELRGRKARNLQMGGVARIAVVDHMSLGFATRAEALEAIARLQAEKRDGHYVEKSRMTVAQDLDAGRPGTWEENTKRDHWVCIQGHIKPLIAYLRSQEITSRDIDALFNVLMREGSKQQSIEAEAALDWFNAIRPSVPAEEMEAPDFLALVGTAFALLQAAVLRWLGLRGVSLLGLLSLMAPAVAGLVPAALGLPATTVRGWLRRFQRRAAAIWALAVGLAHRDDPELGPIEARGSPVSDAVEALGVAVAALIRRFGPIRSTWEAVSAMTGALLLSPTALPTW